MFYPKLRDVVEFEGFQTGQYTSWVHADYQLIDDISGSALYTGWVGNMSAWLDYMYHRQRYKKCWTESKWNGSQPLYTQNGNSYTPTFSGTGCDGGFVDIYHTGTAPGGKAWLDFDFDKWQGLGTVPGDYGNVLSEDGGNKIYNTNPGYKYVWPDVKNFISSTGQMVSASYTQSKPDALARFSSIILASLRSKAKYDLGDKFVNLNGGIFDTNGAVSLFNRGAVTYTLPDTLATTINGGNSIAKDNWILSIPIKGYCKDIHNTECATSMKYSFFDFSNPGMMDAYIRISLTDYSLSPISSPGLFQKEYYLKSTGALSYDGNIANANTNISQLTAITPTFLSFLPYYTRKYIIKYVFQRQTAIKNDLSGSYVQLKSKVITEMAPVGGQDVKNVAFLNGLAQAYYELYNGTQQIIRIYDACTIGTSIVDVRCDIQVFGDPAPIQAALDLSGSQYIQGRYDSTKHRSEVNTIIANYRDVASTLQFNQTQNYLQLQQLYDKEWNTLYSAQVETLIQTRRNTMDGAKEGTIPINTAYYDRVNTLTAQINALYAKKITADPALGATDYSASGIYLRFFIDTNGKPCGFSEGINAALSFNKLYNSYIQVPTGNYPGTINYTPVTSYTKNPKAILDCTTATGLKMILADYQDLALADISGELIRAGWDLTGILVIESVVASMQLTPLECIIVWNESIYDESNKKLSGPNLKGAFFRYKQNVDQWYAKENLFDSSGFHMATPGGSTATATGYSLTFEAAVASAPYNATVAGKVVAVPKMTTPILFPKVLADEVDLDTGSGLCPAIRCDSILPKLIDKFNNDSSEPGTILRVTKVTTPTPLTCDIEADINYDIVKQTQDGSDPVTTSKTGIIQEKRSFLINFDIGTCGYEAYGYGESGDGYSIQDTTPALKTPFSYGEYAKKELTDKTAGLFQPITNTLTSAYSAITTAINPFRKTTYTTIGKMNSFNGCPQVKCSDPAIMSEFIKAYEKVNWQTSRINSIMGAGQLDSLTCDFTYDVTALMIDPATNAVVKGPPQTYGARCTMVLDTTVGSCYYKVASFVSINPSPNYESLKIFATKPTTVSMFAKPYMNDRPLVYIDCKSKLASYLIKQRGRYWFSIETISKYPHALLDAKNLDLQTCSFNLVLTPSMNGSTDKYFSTEARQYFVAAAGTVINAKRTYRFIKDDNNRFTLDEPVISFEANDWSSGRLAANGKPYIQKISQEYLSWNAGTKTGSYIWGKPVNFDWKTYTPKPIRVDISNVQLNFATTCPQVDCASASVQAISGLSVRAAGQVNYNTCEFLVTDISGLPFGESVKNVSFYTDDYPATCSVGVRTVEPGVETASKWKYVPNPSDPALLALTRSTFANRYSVSGSEKTYNLIKFVSGGVQSDLTVVYEVVLQEFDKDGNLTHFYGSTASVATPEPARFIAVHFRRDFDSTKPVYIYSMGLLDKSFAPAQVATGSQLYLTPYTADATREYQSVQYMETKFVSDLQSLGSVYFVNNTTGQNYGINIPLIRNELPVPVKYTTGPSYTRVPITDTAVVPNPTATMTAFKYLKVTLLGSPDTKDSLVELLRYNFYAGTKLLLFPSGSFSLLANSVTGKTVTANPGSFYEDPTVLATTADLTTLKHMSLPVGYSILIQNPIAVSPTSFSFMTGYNAYRNPTRWLVEGSVNGVYWKKLHDQRTADFVYPVQGPSYYLSPMFDLNGGAAALRTQLANIPKNFFDCGVVATDWKYAKSIYDAGLQQNIKYSVPSTNYDTPDRQGDSLTVNIYTVNINWYIVSYLENAIYYQVSNQIAVQGEITPLVNINPSYANVPSAPASIQQLYTNNFISYVKIVFNKSPTCLSVIPSVTSSTSLSMPVVQPSPITFTSPTNVPVGLVFPLGWGGFENINPVKDVGSFQVSNMGNLTGSSYSDYGTRSNFRTNFGLTASFNPSKYIGFFDKTNKNGGVNPTYQANNNIYIYQPPDIINGYTFLAPTGSVITPATSQVINTYSGTNTGSDGTNARDTIEYHFFIRKDLLIAKAIRFTPTKLRSSTATTCSIGLISFSINGSPISIKTAVATSGSTTYQGTPVSSVYSGTVTSGVIDTTTESLQITAHSFTGVPYSATSRPAFVITFVNQSIFNSYTFSTSTDVVGNDPLQWTMDYSIDGTTWLNFHTFTTDAPMPTVRGSSVAADVTTLAPNFTQLPPITTCTIVPTNWSILGPFFTKFAMKQGVNIVWISQYGYIAVTNTVYYIVNTDSTPDMYVKLPLNTANCALIQIPTLYISSTAFPEQPTMAAFTGITNMATGAALPQFWGGFSLGTCATKSDSLLAGWTANEWISANALISDFNKSGTIGTQNYSQFIIRITDTSYNDSQNSVTYKFTSGLLLTGGTIVNPSSLNTGVLAPYYTNNFTQYATVVFNKNNCKTFQTVVSIAYSWTSSATFTAFNPVTRIPFMGSITLGRNLFLTADTATITLPIGATIVGGTVAPGTTITSIVTPSTVTLKQGYNVSAIDGANGFQADVASTSNPIPMAAVVNALPAILPYGYGGFSPSFCGITTANDTRVLYALLNAYQMTNLVSSAYAPGQYGIYLNNIISYAYDAMTTTAYFYVKAVIMYVNDTTLPPASQLTILINPQKILSPPAQYYPTSGLNTDGRRWYDAYPYAQNSMKEYVKIKLGYSDCQTIPVTITRSWTAFPGVALTSLASLPSGFVAPKGYGLFSLTEYGTSPVDWSVISPMIAPLTQTASATINGISYNFKIIPSSIKQYAFDSVQNAVYYQVKLYIRTTGAAPPGNLTINPVSFTTLTSTPVLTPTLASYYTNNFLLTVKLTYNKTDGTAACTFNKIETTWTAFTGQPAWVMFPGVVNPPATYPSGWGGMYVRNPVTTTYIKYYPLDTTLRINDSAYIAGQMMGNFYFKPTLYFNGNKVTIPAGTQVSTVTNDYDANSPWKIPATANQFYPIDANGHINYNIDYAKQGEYRLRNGQPYIENGAYARVYYTERPLYDGTDLVTEPPKYLANQDPSVLLDGKLTTYVLTDLEPVGRTDSTFIYFYIVFPSPVTFDSLTFTLPSTPTISSSVVPARGWNIMTSTDGITYTTFHKFTILPVVNSVRFIWPFPLQGNETSVISAAEQLVETPTAAMISAAVTTANANLLANSSVGGGSAGGGMMTGFIDYASEENFQNPPTQTGPMSLPVIQSVKQFMSGFHNPFNPISQTYNHETRECQYLQDDSSLVSIYFNTDGSVDTANSNPRPFKLSRMNGVPDTLFQGKDMRSRDVQDTGFKSLYNRSFKDDFEQPLMTPSRAGESRAFPQGGVAPVADTYMLTTSGPIYKYIRVRFLKTRVDDAPYVQIGGLQLYGEKDQLLTGKISNLMGSPVDATTDVRALAKGGTWTDTNKSPLMIAFDEPEAVVAFGFTTATVAKSTAFDPVRWKVEGSMNGHLWTPLLSQEYMTPMARGVTTPPFRFTQA